MLDEVDDSFSSSGSEFPETNIDLQPRSLSKQSVTLDKDKIKKYKSMKRRASRSRGNQGFSLMCCNDDEETSRSSNIKPKKKKCC